MSVYFSFYIFLTIIVYLNLLIRHSLLTTSGIQHMQNYSPQVVILLFPWHCFIWSWLLGKAPLPTPAIHKIRRLILTLFVPCFNSWFQKDKNNKSGDFRKPLGKRQQTRCHLKGASNPQCVRTFGDRHKHGTGSPFKVISERFGSESEEGKAAGV